MFVLKRLARAVLVYNIEYLTPLQFYHLTQFSSTMDVFDNIDALMADPKVQLATNALVRRRLRYQLPTSAKERHPPSFFLWVRNGQGSNLCYRRL